MIARVDAEAGLPGRGAECGDRMGCRRPVRAGGACGWWNKIVFTGSTATG